MASTEGPDIAVVVSTYCRPDGLARLLTALEQQTLSQSRWEVVVVDNGSGPPTAHLVDELVAASRLRVRAIHIETNHGPAPARNLGWRSCDAQIVAFTDDDCVPLPEWLAEGLRAFEASSRTGVVQGRTTRPHGSDEYRYSYFTAVREVLAPSPWFEGCNLFLRREALDDTGGFEEAIGFFCEDTALGWSVLKAGWRRAWAEEAVVEHDLSERPWSWHLRFHYLEGNIVRMAKRYPQIRSTFWRPWAVKKENALFACAVLGLLIGTRQRIGLLLAVPYIRWLSPMRDGAPGLKAAWHQASLHAASLAGKAMVGVREGTFLL